MTSQAVQRRGIVGTHKGILSMGRLTFVASRSATRNCWHLGQKGRQKGGQARLLTNESNYGPSHKKCPIGLDADRWRDDKSRPWAMERILPRKCVDGRLALCLEA